MVNRITTSQRFSVALRNILTSLNRVQETQEQIVTGKRIIRPSDDPGGFAKISNLRRLIQDSVQFRRNIESSEGFLNVTDQTLGSIRSLLQEARTLAVGQAGAPSDAVTRTATAAQVARIRESIIELANTQVGGRFIFSGTEIFTKAFASDGSYQGNLGQLDINIGISSARKTNVTGADFLTTDLDPILFQTAAFVKGTSAVTDRFLVNASNDNLVLKLASSGASIPIAIDTGTHSNGALASLVQLRVNNQVKEITSTNNSLTIREDGGARTGTVTLGSDFFEVTSRNNTIRIVEDGGAQSDTVTVAAGTKSGATLATELKAALDASGTLLGTYTVTYDQPTDKFTIAVAGGAATTQVDATGGALAGLIGFTTTSASAASVVSDSATPVLSGAALAADLQNQLNLSADLGGTYTVTYDAATDKYTVAVAGGASTMEVDTTSATGLAALMGFTTATGFVASAVSNTAFTGVKVTYDAAGDAFTFENQGNPPGNLQVISAGTDATSTAAALLGFTVDSLQTTKVTSNVQTAFNVITGVNDTFSVQVDGGTSTPITVAAGVYTGQALAANMQLKINNNVKEVTASNNTITILEDGGIRSDTVTVAAGTKSGATLATDLTTALNASGPLTGTYTVTYDAATDKFTISVAGAASTVGVDVTKGKLDALMGFTAASPFAGSVVSDTAFTGAKVDYDDSFKDSFTVSSPTKGGTSSIALTAGATDILPTLNLNGATAVASRSTRLADLNGGKGVKAGSISITNRAGQVFTVDLSTAIDLDDVFSKIENAVSGVKATISSDGKRIVLTDSNSPPISNLIVKEVGTTTTAADLGILGDVPGNIVGRDVDPAVTSDTLAAALRSGQGVRLGSVQIGITTLDLDIGSKVSVGDILSTVNTVSTLAATASVSADGKHLDLNSTDATKSVLMVDVTGSSAKDLGFQGATNALGLLDILEEALRRNDVETIGASLDILTEALERVGTQQVEIGQVTRQFDRFKDQQDEINLSFTEVLSNVEDVDMVEALTRFSIFQNTLQASLASSAQILEVQLLDFLR